MSEKTQTRANYERALKDSPFHLKDELEIYKKVTDTDVIRQQDFIEIFENQEKYRPEKWGEYLDG